MVMVGILPLLFFAGLYRRNESITRAWRRAQARAIQDHDCARGVCRHAAARRHPDACTVPRRPPRQAARSARGIGFPALFRPAAPVNPANAAAVSSRAAPAASTARRLAPAVIVITIKLFSASGRRHTPATARIRARRKRHSAGRVPAEGGDAMHMALRSILIGACAAAAMAIGGAQATIVGHNGTVGSTPPGSGAVDVALNCTPIAAAAGDICTKDFGELATHSMTVVYPGGANLQETIVNNSGTPWTDFHFAISGGQFTDTGFLNLPDGVTADVSPTPTTIDLLFQGGTIGIGQSFEFSMFLGGVNTGEFTAVITQEPTVAAPEPASMMLLGGGLVGLALLRFRARARRARFRAV